MRALAALRMVWASAAWMAVDGGGEVTKAAGAASTHRDPYVHNTDREFRVSCG